MYLSLYYSLCPLTSLPQTAAPPERCLAFAILAHIANAHVFVDNLRRFDVTTPTLRHPFPAPVPAGASSHPHSATVLLSVYGLELTLDLELNHGLLPPSAVSLYPGATGEPLARRKIEHCFYQGGVRGYTDSLVSLSTCGGHLSGVVRLSSSPSGGLHFGIEPAHSEHRAHPSFPAGSLHTHFVYQHGDLVDGGPATFFHDEARDAARDEARDEGRAATGGQSERGGRDMPGAAERNRVSPLASASASVSALPVAGRSPRLRRGLADTSVPHRWVELLMVADYVRPLCAAPMLFPHALPQKSPSTS